MKMRKKFGMMLTVFCLLSGFFVNLTVKADNISEDTMAETMAEPEATTEAETEPEATTETETEPEAITETEPETTTETETEPETTTETETEPETTTEAETGSEITTEPAVESEVAAVQDSKEELQNEKKEESSDAESEVLDEVPAFEACLEYSPQGWRVKGFFKDFAADTILVQPMCSTDGETYRDCGQKWNLEWLGSENEKELAGLYNQRCLYASEEPLKTYLAKELTRFYIKLRVVRENGFSYETQTAVIERGELQPMSPEFDANIRFASNVFVREGWPPNFQCFGRYQMTVSEDATNEEIAAFLPDTLPVEIQIQKGSDYIGNDIIDCPVKWKPLNIPQLTAGESVTVLDAAEEIVIPAGTVLKTQTGIYQINEPISMDQCGITDEVRIVLNVVAKDGRPAGVLTKENHGLEMTFHLKPTGATSIRAYTITESQEEWKELLGLLLTDAVNAQPSTANSGYVVVLESEQEPYRSYLEAQEAEEEPVPFFVGLKIEGGVYDGTQLVLAWPDTYELPPNLPKVGGSGGNQGNAGSDDEDDSTEGGQRPGLPQDPEDETIPEPTEEPKPEEPKPEEPKPKLPRPQLPEKPVIEAIPAIGKIEILENEALENEMLEEKTPENKMSENEKKVSEISENEILENEVPENKTSEISMEVPGQQQELAPHVQYESAVQSSAEANAEIEEELPEGMSDTVAAMDTELSAHVEESMQEESEYRISSANKKVFFAAALGIAVLGGVGIIVFQGAARVKIMKALRSIFTL